MHASYSAHSLLLLCLTTSFFAANAQVHEAAVGASPHLWVGVEGSDFRTDYNPIGGRLLGIGVYGDYYIKRSIGLEGEVRFLDLNKPSGQTQKSFLAGPTGTVYRWRNLSGNVKFLVGVGTINYPYIPNTTTSLGYGSYFELEPGGNVEYRLTSRLKIRGEYDYQFLPSAPGIAITFPAPSNGLTESGYSGGISYKIF